MALHGVTILDVASQVQNTLTIDHLRIEAGWG